MTDFPKPEDAPYFPYLIGLCGGIGAGKDTVGRFLREDYGFETVSFASKLKEVAADVYGLEERHVNGTQADKLEPIGRLLDPNGQPLTGRRILELLGTEGFRNVSPTTWVDYLMRRIDRETEATVGRCFVITDCRFPNEFDAVRERGGVMWRVEKTAQDEHTSTTGHASDVAWRDLEPDVVVSAAPGDMAGLRAAVTAGLGKSIGVLADAERRYRR